MRGRMWATVNVLTLLEAMENRAMLDGSPFGLASFTPLGAEPIIFTDPGGHNAAPLPVVDQVLVSDLNGDSRPDMTVLSNNGVAFGVTATAVKAAKFDGIKQLDADMNGSVDPVFTPDFELRIVI